MTNTPGDGQTPEDENPDTGHSGENQPGNEQPGYWEQQSQPQQPPYAQPGYGQPVYGQPPGYPAQAPMQYAPDHPKSTTVLVLGILGLVICGIIAPFAWSMGKTTLAEIDASNGTLGGRGAANAGYIMGIIGTILLGLGVLFFVLFLAVVVVGSVSSSTS